MTKVLFVGQTLVTKHLAGWIKEINPDCYELIGAFDAHRSPELLKVRDKAGFKFIAFGSIASDTIRSLGIIHLKIPRPDSSDPRLKDKKAIKQMIATAKKFIKSK